MKYKFVYFIAPVGMEGPIKIGCAVDVDRRLSALNACSPFPLEVLAVHSGGPRLERQLHAHFWCAHSHKEWFLPTPELLVLIDGVKRGRDIADEVASVKIRRMGGPKSRATLHEAV